MRNMIYLILYKFGNDKKELSFKETLKALGDTILCFHNAMFLRCTVPLNDVYQRLLPHVRNGEGYVMVTEFDRSKANGLISERCVKWLDDGK